jgi:hypothetical protein
MTNNDLMKKRDIVKNIKRRKRSPVRLSILTHQKRIRRRRRKRIGERKMLMKKKKKKRGAQNQSTRVMVIFFRSKKIVTLRLRSLRVILHNLPSREEED